MITGISNALYINQQARIYGGKLNKGVQYIQHIEHQMYVLVSSGNVKISDNQSVIGMLQGDGAEITKQNRVTIEALEESEIILIDAPM